MLPVAIITYIILAIKLTKMLSAMLFQLLCRATSTMARPAIRARAAAFGHLRGAVVPACTASTWVRALWTPPAAPIGTTASQLDVYLSEFSLFCRELPCCSCPQKKMEKLSDSRLQGEESREKPFVL